MDLSLSEPSDGKDDHMFFESNYHVGGVGSFGHSTVHSPEDSLNEKSHVQELRILIDKADEEIMKLEEDILMLNCQIAWDDEDWSKQCFIALSAQINHFDILIKSIKKTEIAEDLHYLVEQPEKLAPRLPDILKPLLENYLKRKSKQVTDPSWIHGSTVTTLFFKEGILIGADSRETRYGRNGDIEIGLFGQAVM